MSLFRDQVKVSDRVTGTGRKQSPIKTDSKLFLCPRCRCVWEIERKTSGAKRQLTYNHIPRYGKKQKICEFCL